MDSSAQEESGVAKEEEDFVLNPDDLAEPHRFNWFKYLLDTQLKTEDEEGNKSALQSADGYINLLNIVISTKPDDEIQNELMELVGFHNFTLLE